MRRPLTAIFALSLLATLPACSMLGIGGGKAKGGFFARSLLEDYTASKKSGI